MQILVVSDTHGRGGDLAALVEKNRRAECVVHLGDSQWTEETLAAHCAPLPLVAVGGNCDGGGYPQMRILALGEHRILLTHGHRHGVRFGDLQGLVSLAKENQADIVLYGHTHVASERWEQIPGEERMVYLCNPGSLSKPRDGAPSFGILTLQGKHALFSVGRL